MSSSDNHARLAGPHEDFDAYLRLSKARTQWRVRSRACAFGDTVAATAGGVLVVVPAVNSLLSWPSDRVLLDHHGLSHLAALILIPGWTWLLLSLALVLGLQGSHRDQGLGRERRATLRMLWRTMYPMVRLRMGLGLMACLCVGVVVGGFVVGAAKGDVRVLPGPRYEVSTLDLNQAAWTQISAGQYSLWQARFIRQDGFLTLFGFALSSGGLGLLQLHRTAGDRLREIRA